MNNMVNKFNLVGIYRTLYPTTEGYIFEHGTFAQADRALHGKTTLNTFKG